MTELEKEMLTTINNAKDPTKALITAIDVITDFLKRSLSSQEQEDGSPPEPS